MGPSLSLSRGKLSHFFSCLFAFSLLTRSLSLTLVSPLPIDLSLSLTISLLCFLHVSLPLCNTILLLEFFSFTNRSIALTYKGNKFAVVIISLLSTKIPILCFEFQAWFSFFSKKFSVWWIPGISYFFLVHKVQKNYKRRRRRRNGWSKRWKF